LKRCWSTHGNVDFLGAIAHSCDTFFYRYSLIMGIQPICRMARAFGLGHRTGIDLTSEAKGNIPTPRERSTRGHPRNWWPGDTANAAIGQGYILATPLQMAVAAAALANGGTVYQPHVLKKAVSIDGRQLASATKQVVSRIPLSPDNIELIRLGMKAAVQRGTCRGAALPGIEVAGKTGSAEVAGSRKTHGWFICFAPYQNPTIAIAVIVERAGHGGTVAVPVARRMLEAHFGLTHSASVLPGRTD
ncbi:MAG: penicillin-binding transpeptidase domain-containing protein, partial [Armatimonadota bacterium]